MLLKEGTLGVVGVGEDMGRRGPLGLTFALIPVVRPIAFGLSDILIGASIPLLYRKLQKLINCLTCTTKQNLVVDFDYFVIK